MIKKIRSEDIAIRLSIISIIVAIPPVLFHDSFLTPKIILFTLSTIYLLNFDKNEKVIPAYTKLIWLFPFMTFIVSIHDEYNFFLNFFGDYKRGFGIYTTFLAIMFIALSGNLPKLDNIKILKYLFVAVSVIVIYQLLQIFNLDILKLSNAQTYSSLIGNINMAGSIVAALSLTLISINFTFKKNWKLVLTICIPLLLYSLYKFNSMQAYLVLLVGFFTFFYFKIIEKSKLNNFFALLIYLCSWTIGILVLFTASNIGWLFDFLNKDGNFARRLDYWNYGLQIFKEDPLFGVGLNGFLDKYNKLRNFESVRRDGADAWIDSPHSVPIQMLSSGGFLLFLSWLIFILVISYIAIKNFRESQNKVENKVQITLASVWFGFCSQYFVSIWEVTTIIFTSVLAAIIINQRTRNKLTLLKNTKLNFLGIENIQKWILSFFLILISLYLLFMQFNFANYANTKNPSNSRIVSIIKYYPNYYLIDFLAYSDLTKSRVNEAINLERISVELNPRNSKAFYQLGISYNYFNQFSNAENALLNALRNDPVNVYILDQLVRAQIGQDKLVEARQNFNKILMIDSEFKNIEVLRNLLKN